MIARIPTSLDKNAILNRSRWPDQTTKIVEQIKKSQINEREQTRTKGQERGGRER